MLTEISRMVKDGRPTLVGTTSVERSEALARLLVEEGIDYQVRCSIREWMIIILPEPCTGGQWE